jgi:transcriptional regulator with XRE-family HTH domain
MAQDSRKTFGQYVAWARRKAGLNLRDMAALIKKEDGTPISNQYLSDIENDKRNPPSDHLIEQIAKILGEYVEEVTPEVLYLKARRVPPYIDSEHVDGYQARELYEAMRKQLETIAA